MKSVKPSRDTVPKSQRNPKGVKRSRAQLVREARIEFFPLTPDRWDDLTKLFGSKGACGGCWCMHWRLSSGTFDAEKGEGNRRAFQRLVRKGPPPGLLAYVDGNPVGWCAVAPREEFPRLNRSRILAPVDNAAVWSIPCFFIEPAHRRSGLSVLLLRAACEFASSHGAAILEGYPVDPKSSYPDTFAFVGLSSAFRKAGFREVAKRSESRPIMRVPCPTADGEKRSSLRSKKPS